MAQIALSLAEDVVKAIVGLIDAAVDALFGLLQSPISIAFVTTFYEKVVMGGNGQKLTLLNLLTLAGALPASVIHKARFGQDQPLFTKAQRDAFLALKPDQYTWVQDPFTRSAPNLAADPRASVGADIDLYALGVAAGCLAGVGTLALWGVNGYNDRWWIARTIVEGSSSQKLTPPKQPRYQIPIALLNLAAQDVCWIAGSPFTTFTYDLPTALSTTLWAIQLVPLLSNAVATYTDVAKLAFQWGDRGDPILTAAHGYVCTVLTALLAWQQVAAAKAMPRNTPEQIKAADLALTMALDTGAGNLLGALAWEIQWIKALPSQVIELEPHAFAALVGALLILDSYAYPSIAATYFIAAGLIPRPGS